MEKIFEYFDFREFLGDYYSEKKTANPLFSYQSFTEKCGFKNKSFLHQIIHTRKQISKSSIYAISKALNLSKKESHYFESLVAFNQAKTLEEKTHFYQELTSLQTSSKDGASQAQVKQDHFEYYAKWYHGAIRAIIDLHKFKDDYQFLANVLYPPITVKEAKKGVELLERLGFIYKDESGYYKVTDKFITTGDEVISTAVMNFHQQTTRLAHNAINNVSREKRNISGLMLGISSSGYTQICQKISEFRKELLKIAENDTEANTVYQLNLHMFPLVNPKTTVNPKKD